MATETVQALVDNLDEPTREAIALLQQFIRVYGRGDGTGMFSGVARYQVLEERARLAATQSRTAFEFGARLMRIMQWPVPASKEDEALVAALSTENAAPMLAVLMRDTAAIVMLARHSLREDREARKESTEQLGLGGVA